MLVFALWTAFRFERPTDEEPTKEERMAKPNPIPSDYPRMTPYLSIDGAAAAIDFYCDVLGAVEKLRMPGPGGKVAHAELAIGDSMLMLADVMPGMGGPTPKQLGGTPMQLMVYVDDVDDVFARALKAGATEVMAVQDQFYGDRSGTFEDQWGYRWNVASHVEDVAPEEMEKRAQEAMGG
jgi:PhnB protein